MDFYSTLKETIVKDDFVFPCIVLTHDSSWNDYSIQTLFQMYYYKSKGECYKIGKIKIMKKGENVTILPTRFPELDNNYCSLGVDINFYETLQKHLPNAYEQVLEDINDAATNPGIAADFENHPTFQNSLIRFSESEKAFKTAFKILNGTYSEESFEFSYSCKLPNADSPHIVDFKFNFTSHIPQHIWAIIGKNGTGKTQYLAKLALDLSGQSKRKKVEQSFRPNRPLISKVIAVSFSTFDKFSRPNSNKKFSYIYCGIKDEKGVMSEPKFNEAFKNAVLLVKERNNFFDIEGLILKIFEKEIAHDIYRILFVSNNFDEFFDKINDILSSGQKFLLYVITNILAYIRKESLLLIDEPEMHLHPNAIAHFIRSLHDLLKKYRSFAIVSTHSPIILQEIPSTCSIVFERIGNTPYIRPLEIETFGNSISEINDQIFSNIEVESTYKEFLITSANKYSFEEINSWFDNRLGFGAQLYLPDPKSMTG